MKKRFKIFIIINKFYALAILFLVSFAYFDFILIDEMLIDVVILSVVWVWFNSMCVLIHKM